MRTRRPTSTTPTVGAHERADSKPFQAALASLAVMNAADLRREWVRVYRFHPPKKLSRDLLKLGVAWKLQERALGGLSAVTKRQIAELAQTMATKEDLAKPRAVTLRPGARLIREWNGEIHEILVVEGGFVWRGKTWCSLSAIAREMTGTKWSGPRFFGVGQTRAAPSSSAATGEGG